MPAAVKYVMMDDRINWRYYTEPQINMDGRQLEWPRARLLGGCSSHNTMVFVRGHTSDYDHWRQLGCEGWSYADVLPYFQRSESHANGKDDYRGDTGPMQVRPADFPHILNQVFLDAGVEAGFPYSGDFNGQQQEGVGRFDVNVYNGKRWNTSRAYLWPVQTRRNLDVQTNAYVTRILFKSNRAVGLELSIGGRVHKVETSGKVVLSAGAINTPQLLMLSGVGEPTELAAHGVPVTIELPAVGKNLQDHLDIGIQNKCLQPVTLVKYNRPHLKALIGLQWLLFNTGLGTSGHFEVGSFLRTNSSVASSDIQHHFLPLAVFDNGRTWPKEHSFQLSVCQLRQESRGFLTLRSADPSDHPVIQPNYLQTEEDRRCLRDGVKITRDIIAQNAFGPYRGAEIQPGPSCKTDADIDAFVRARAETTYHPCGTCKMGTDENSVVDPHLRVVGTEGLRVADAPVIPAIVSGNLNAPTIMIAEKASDLILGRVPLPRADVSIAQV